MLVAVHGLAVRSASDAIRAPLTAVVETGCAVARHPVARIAPPAPAIISATPSRARVGERYGKRGQFSADRSVQPAPRRFGARAKPSAVSGHHPMTTPMSLGWRRVSCWSARCAVDHHRRRAAPNPRRRPIGTNKPSTPAAGDRPLPHTAPHKLLAQVEHPAGRSRMLVAVHGLAVRSASDAIRAPLTAVVETGCAVARHPVARTAPPAPAIIGAHPLARASGCSESGKRCQIF